MPTRPSLPTPKQIREAHEVVAELYPGARIKQVGPEGVIFEYPAAGRAEAEVSKWQGRPFSAEGT